MSAVKRRPVSSLPPPLPAPAPHSSLPLSLVLWSKADWHRECRYCDIPIRTLCRTTELVVRCFDASKNSQPEVSLSLLHHHLSYCNADAVQSRSSILPVHLLPNDAALDEAPADSATLAGNYTGMMNNCWYRVKLHTDVDKATGQPVLLARHPIAPGGAEGGWMRPSAEEKAKQEASDAAQSTSKEYTLEEVEKHNTEVRDRGRMTTAKKLNVLGPYLQKDCWLILNGKVYDATSILAWHPGGASAILNYAGKATAQASADYNAVHDAYAQKKTAEVLIGKLSAKGMQTLLEDQKHVEKKQAEQAESRQEYALKPFQYTPATLVKRKEINTDTRLYTFKVPDGKDGKPGRLGLHVGGHIQIASHWNDAVVMRPYTPTRPVLPEEEDGTFGESSLGCVHSFALA